MAENENCQKIKLLLLNELLRQESDEEHPMTTGELCRRLEARGITCDRRTLSRDMETLNRYGYEIMDRMVGHEKGYYVEDRAFDGSELKILIDAVQAAGFITEKKTAELTDKIARLGGSHRAELLVGGRVRFNARKHTNETVYYTVAALDEAIRRKHRVSFVYFDLGLDGERLYRRNGERYVTDPLAMIYHEDNYYLLTYNEKHGDLTNYRLDRMASVEEEEDGICRAACLRMKKLDLSDYTRQAFRMFGGQSEAVTLEFERSLVGAVYDKFGEDTAITAGEDGRCRCRVTVQISPTFFGWLFQFGTDMRIASPDSAREAYRKQLQSALGSPGPT